MKFEGIKDGFILINQNKYIFVYLKNDEINVKCTDKEYTDKSIFFTCMLLYNLMDFTEIKQMFKDNICKNRFKDYIFKDCKEYILKKQSENSKSNHSDLTNQFLEIIHST